MKLKRMFDIVVVSLAALAWIPVVTMAALAVLVLSGRPIFYRSHRWVGPGVLIQMVKLRVMVPDANKVKDCDETDHFLNTKPDSPLYTPIGRLLDRLGLNEIPQFIHVLRGEMSIVGARPLTEDVRLALVERHRTIDERWQTPAGLTGLPQLVGRSVLTDGQRLELEAAYCRAAVEGYRLRTDFMILLYTVLITFGLKKPMSFTEALAVVQTRRARIHDLATQQPYAAAGDADAVA
ncbi:sugar transferase [Nocardioides sp. SYSU DS0651]|uniref:sugar transferase n=1 Tax=Nocardioides sp. SYSU DS0651 TaxID=3415955 RepID=UPI003F4BB28D